MSTTSTRLPAWLRRHGVTGLCLLVVLLISLSLSKQSIDFLRLLRSEAAPPPAPTDIAERRPPSIQRLQNLFGTPAARPRGDQAAPATRQQMTLLASFVNPDAQRSAAIIQVAGAKPKRIAVGEPINASTRLQAVHRDHVVLDRGGLEESLHFPAVRQATATPSYSAPEPSATQLEQLQDEDVQALQERIQTLQQRMEGGDIPQPETPEAEDNP